VKVPLLEYLGAASQLVPLAVAALARRAVRGPRAWVLAWCGILACADGLSLALGVRHQTNLLVINLVTPVGGAIVLWALSSWQLGGVPRLTLRLAIVPFVLAWLVLTMAFDESETFSRVADPMASLVGLGAAAFTLLARSRSAVGLLHRRDWFWISAGMALYFGTASALAPLSALLVGDAPALMDRAYQVKSLLDVFAFLAIARGVTCPAGT
jgi:hypothetical protein